MKNNPTCFSKTFFSEIGKYKILSKQEEEIEIDNIYKHKEILAIALVSVDPNLIIYLDLIKIREKIGKKTGQKVQTVQWAKAAGIPAEELKSIKNLAYNEWAKIAQTTVARLISIEKKGMLARENIILGNLRLVVKIAQVHQNRGLDLLDLIQEGVLGLEYSIDKFDRRLGFRFTTYASHWIKKFMLEFINQNSRIIRLPENLIRLIASIKKNYKLLYAIDGKQPSLAKISARIDISEEKIRQGLEKDIKVLSANVKIDRENSQEELLDIIPAQNQEYNTIENRSIGDALHDLILTQLNVKERQVINLRYFQDTHNTLAQVGEFLEISGEGVRKIEIRAITKLRQSLDLAI
jgi:RNA polymerase nonessential primary-like sigma factor